MLITAGAAIGARPDVVWAKTFGGDYDDTGRSIVEAADGGYVIAGSTNTYMHVEYYKDFSGKLVPNYMKDMDGNVIRNYDVYLLKVDANGNLLWNKTYGERGNDWGTAVARTSDGGYIVAGYTSSYAYGIKGGNDTLLLKVDANGNLQWNRTYGGSGQEKAYAVAQTADGGYIVAGGINPKGDAMNIINYNDYDLYLLRVDASGNMLWSKSFGGTDGDTGYAVVQAPDGGFIVAGYSDLGTVNGDYHGRDAILIKVDKDGNQLWQQIYGGSGSDEAASLIKTADGGYAFAGTANPNGWSPAKGTGEMDLYLVKTDADGNMQWQRLFGHDDYNIGSAVVQTPDGGYFVAGHNSSRTNNNMHLYLVRTDASGNLVREDNYGGDGQQIAASALQDRSGNFVVAGRARLPGAADNVYVLKLAAEAGFKPSPTQQASATTTTPGTPASATPVPVVSNAPAPGSKTCCIAVVLPLLIAGIAGVYRVAKK